MNRQSSKNDKALQRDALLLFKVLNDKKIPAKVREYLGNYADDVASISPLIPNIREQRELFIKCVVDGVKRADDDLGAYSRDSYLELIKSLKAGESPEEIAARFEREGEEKRAQLKAESTREGKPLIDPGERYKLSSVQVRAITEGTARSIPLEGDEAIGAVILLFRAFTYAHEVGDREDMLSVVEDVLLPRTSAAIGAVDRLVTGISDAIKGGRA